MSLALSAAAPNPAFYLVETQESHTWFNMHCNENPIHVFLLWPLRAGWVPIFQHSCVCERFIHIFPGSVHIFSCSRRGRSMVGIYTPLTDTWMWNYNFYTQISVRDLYISRIGLSILLLPNMWTDSVNIEIAHTDAWMWRLGLWPRNSFSGNIFFKFSVLVLCSVVSDRKTVFMSKHLQL